MVKRQSPCMGCEDRCIGCHTTCGDYAIYTRELAAIREAENAEKDEIAFTKSVKARISKKGAQK